MQQAEKYRINTGDNFKRAYHEQDQLEFNSKGKTTTVSSSRRCSKLLATCLRLNMPAAKRLKLCRYLRKLLDLQRITTLDKLQLLL